MQDVQPTGSSWESLDRRFVQDRVALFGKTIFWIALTFLLLAGLFSLIGAERGLVAHGREGHLLAALVALGIWRLARRPQLLSLRALQLLDGAGTLCMCGFAVLMGHHLAAYSTWGFFAGTLAVFHVALARAIVIPSPATRTLVISALSFAPLVVSAQLLPTTPTGWSTPQRWIGLLGPLTWSATGTALATLASSVIYGLRREVVKARQLGQYTLEAQIGAGGMGEIYRARHALLRRPTAIKLIRGAGSAEQVARFEREVQLTASLTHPNTISIYDFGRTPDGTFYYVMELLDGATLQEVVERTGAQPPARVIHWLLQVCAALSEAHAAGMIHRDIKPANIFACRLGGMHDVVKVLDFGLVKHLTSGDDTLQSRSEAILGSPLYLSPEAITAPERLDARADLYALGAVGYFLLSGTPVFGGRSVVEVCGLHLHSTPPPLGARTPRPIPGELEQIILDCLQKDPDARPRDAAALAERLRACRDAGAWSEQDARAAFEAVRKVAPVRTNGTGATVQIDLDSRLAPDAGHSLHDPTSLL